MTVTELAFLPIRVGVQLPAVAAAIQRCLDIQDAWCAANMSPPMPRPARARGALFLQQVEDPTVTLLTAHWDSVEQHYDWIRSGENQTAMGWLAEYFDVQGIELLHVDNVAAFAQSDGEVGDGGQSTQDSPVIGVARIKSSTKTMAEMKQAWEAASHLNGYAQHGGRRVEEHADGLGEFVVVSGWDSVEASRPWAAALGEAEVRHYQVLL